MSDTSVPLIVDDLPADLQFGFVNGRFIRAVGDTSLDADDKPDIMASSGTVEFVPSTDSLFSNTPVSAFVAVESVQATIDEQGYLLDNGGNEGIWLVTGQYSVSASISGRLYQATITVTTDDTKTDPVDLPRYFAITPAAPVRPVVDQATADRAEAAATRAETAAAAAEDASELPSRLGQFAQRITSVDTLYGNGFYYGDNLTGAPDTGPYYVFVNASTDSGYVKQQIWKAGLGVSGAGPSWVRFREGSTAGWSPWDQINDANGAVDNTLRGILNPSQRLGPYGWERSGSDLNALTQTGFYRGLSLVNAPVNSDGWFYILVESHDGTNWLKQTVTGYATNGNTIWNTYTRQRENGVWSAWVQIGDRTGAFNTRIQPVGQDVGASVDLNTMQTSGWYIGGSGNPNSPYSGRWIMDVRSAGTGYVYQRLMSIVSAPGWVWERYTNAGVAGGSWSAWRQVVDTNGAIDPTARSTASAAAPKTYVDTNFAQVGRAIATGAGLQGGGTLAADRTLSLTSAAQASLAKADTAVQPAALSSKADLVSGVIPTSQIPKIAINDVFTVASQAAMLALTAERGDMAIRTDVSATFVLSTDSPSTLADWKQLPTPSGSAITSVNGQSSGAIVLGAADVGAVPTAAVANGQVYTKNGSGAVAGTSFGTAASGSNIVQRDSNGQIVVPTPTADSHATSKAYVDSKAGGGTAGPQLAYDAVGARGLAFQKKVTDWATANALPSGQKPKILFGEVGIPNNLSSETAKYDTRYDTAFQAWMEAAKAAGAAFQVWSTSGWKIDLRAYTSSNGTSGDLVSVTNVGTLLEKYLPNNMLNGVNMSGAEFGVSPTGMATVPGTLGTDYYYASDADITFLAGRGIRTIRLPFAWERAQRSIGAALDSTFVANITRILAKAASLGVKVILDCHNYGKYTPSSGATPYKLGQTITATNGITSMNVAFTDLWTRIANQWGTHPGLNGYGLMNEPVGLSFDGSNNDTGGSIWRTASAATALALYNITGISKNIYVSGYFYGTASQWTDWNGSTPWLYDYPAGKNSALSYEPNVFFEAHMYFDDPDGGIYTVTYADNLTRAQNAGYTAGSIGLTQGNGGYLSGPQGATAPAPDLSPYATLASPTFTGAPKVPTAASTVNDTTAASTAFVKANATVGDNAASTASTLAASTVALTSTGSALLRYTLNGNVTFTLAAGTSGRSYTLTVVIVQDTTGSRTVTWPSNIKWSSGARGGLSGTPGSTDMFTLLWTGTEWLGFVGGMSFA